MEEDTRCDKARLVAQYSRLRDNLRVCWAGPMTGTNCGRCEKCVRTQLNFIAQGLFAGAAFPPDLTAEHVSSISPGNIVRCMFMEEVCAEADKLGLVDDRIEALRKVAHLARQRGFASRN
jgi:hypothetical protein